MMTDLTMCDLPPATSTRSGCPPATTQFGGITVSRLGAPVLMVAGLLCSSAVQAAPQEQPGRAMARPASQPASQRSQVPRLLLDKLRRGVARAVGNPDVAPVRGAPATQGAPQPSSPDPPPIYAGGLVADSTEAENWMRRAAEGVEAKNWKLASDALQRLIDMGGDVVVSKDKRVYVSTRRQAHELIAGLPPPGRRAYRLLHDPEAKALYERALRDHDESALLQVVSRLFLTAYGDDAADLLASWYLDAGRASEAAGILTDLLAIYPDSDVPAWMVRGKLALAYAMLDDPGLAERTLSELDARDLPAAEQHARFTELSALVRRIAPPIEGKGLAGWPMLLGRPDRAAPMPQLAPEVLDTAPYLRVLPTHAAPARLEKLFKKTLRPPVFHAVTDGNRLLVKSDARLVALDAVSLDALWQSAKLAAPNRGASGGTRASIPESGEPTELYDDVAGGITLGHGLAFAVGRLVAPVSARGRAAVSRQQGATVVPGWPSQRARSSRGSENQLLAFDLAGDGTGGAGVGEHFPKWVRGGPADPEDLLAGAMFLAPPVPVGACVIAPYARNADLFAGVLRPADGALVRKVFLCGIGNTRVDTRAALHPAVADQVAYVPTGQGLLVAINTTDYSIRWASRYPHVEPGARPGQVRRVVVRGGIQIRTPDPGTAVSKNDLWLSCPPVVAGPTVVLAPTDSDRLHAFDRGTGRIVWDIPRGNHQYIVGLTREGAGASGERGRDLLLIGGTRLSAINVADGESVWSVALGRPTGRGAVVAGIAGANDCVFMPTDRWVAVVDAVTGEILRRTDPPPATVFAEGGEQGGGPPVPAGLGNLLSWGGSLISVDPGTVRVFLEADRAYELARVAHADNPGDTLAAIRLASLELQRDNPRAAVDILDGVRGAEATAEGAARRSWLEHVRVQALIASARLPRTTADDTIALLREACSAAVASDDRLAAGLALAAHRATAGDRVAALLQYADMCISPLGRDLLRPPASSDTQASARRDGPWHAGWRCRGATILASRVAPLAMALTPDEMAKAAQALNVRVDAGLAAHDLDGVRALADAQLSPAVSQRAYLALARVALDEPVPQCEEAQFYLRRAVWRDGAVSPPGDPDLTAEALARLARLSIERFAAPLTAAAHLDELSARYADRTVPLDLIAPDTDAHGGRRVSVAEVVLALQTRLPDGLLRGRAAAAALPRAAPTVGRAGVLEGVNIWPVRFLTDRPEAVTDAAFFLVDDRGANAAVAVERAPAILMCENLDALSHKWMAPLALEEDFAAGQQTQSEAALLLRRNRGTHRETQSPPPAYALADGQTMVVTSTRGVHAVGLSSGLRLWARGLPASQSYAPGAAGPIALADPDGPQGGRMALLVAPTVLEVVSTRDGSAIWRRELSGGTLSTVEIASDRVVAMSQDGQRALLFALADGRFIASLPFSIAIDAQVRKRAARGIGRLLRPVVFDSVVCGTVEKAVIAYDLRTGKEAWRRRATNGSVASLFKPRAGLLGVGSHVGELTLLEPIEGKVLLDGVSVPALQGPIFDAVIHESLIVVQGAALDGKRPRPMLVGWSLGGGRYLWDRALPGGRYREPTQLRAARNAIPLLEPVDSVIEGGLQTVESAVRVTLIDKSTGQSIGSGAQTVISAGFGFSGAIEVWADRIVVGGRQGAVVFRTGTGS